MTGAVDNSASLGPALSAGDDNLITSNYMSANLTTSETVHLLDKGLTTNVK